MIMGAVFAWEDLNKADEVIRNVGLALAALVGLPFLVWRSIVAQQQVRVAEQGQITDRINKAVEGLGAVRVKKSHRSFEKKKHENKPQRPANEIVSYPTLGSGFSPAKGFGSSEDLGYLETSSEERTEPNIEVRLGALYSLERIAQDSPRDHITIMEIICAYVRENTSGDYYKATTHDQTPRTDIQAAISVLARRSGNRIALEHSLKFRLDLRGAWLAFIDFGKGDFTGALLNNCVIEKGNLRDCVLRGCRFINCNLDGASFQETNLEGAFFTGSSIKAPKDAPFFNSIWGANIHGADLCGTDISDIYISNNAPPGLTFGSQRTVLHTDNQIQFERALELKLKVRLHDEAREQSPEEIEAKLELGKNIFRHWSKYDDNDGYTLYLRSEFRTQLGLTGWPYDDD
jgi:hypothetical protein